MSLLILSSLIWKHKNSSEEAYMYVIDNWGYGVWKSIQTVKLIGLQGQKICWHWIEKRESSLQFFFIPLNH